jgi:hypothetical protein
MANGTNGHTPQQGLSLLETVAKMAQTGTQVASRLREFFKHHKGASGLAIIVVVTFMAGGLTWNFFQPGPSPPDPSTAAVVPISANVPNVGLLDGVTITGTWIKQLPKHPGQSYMIGIAFPKPNSCDSSCSLALTDILGQDASCEGQECSAELTDVDEGSKDNSADVYQQCSIYQTGAQKVLIMFSGVRDQANSDFANILLARPSVR